MIKEEAILHRELINKLGEQKYFQIHLPKDIERIIGVETGVFRYASGETETGLNANFGGHHASDPEIDPIDPSFKISFNDPIGNLTLQATENPGIIYQKEVRQTDRNSKWADFTQSVNDEFFDQYSHDRKRYEDVVISNICTPILEGFYKDCWGDHYSYHVQYQLLIYIWIEKKFK